MSAAAITNRRRFDSRPALLFFLELYWRNEPLVIVEGRLLNEISRPSSALILLTLSSRASFSGSQYNGV